MSLRFDFIEQARLGGIAFTELCRRFGISRKTGYKWLSRSRAGEPLSDRSRRPRRSPSQTDTGREAQVLGVRAEHPTWGPRKLHRRLLDLGQDPPAVSTIAAILKRNGCISEEASAAAQPWQRFERAAPNELWQMDYKGHFALSRGGRCHPLTVLDDHSRYLIALEAHSNERAMTTQPALEAAFRRYGLPECILCDNGPPWGGPGGEHTALSVWLMRLGVRVIHGAPFHPQTQGKDERFHRTLKADLLARSDWHDIHQAARAFDHYRRLYNHQRPHQAIGLDTPVRHYRPSRRPYTGAPMPLDYLEGTLTRTVKGKGEITFKNRFFYLGKAFAGLTVALKPTNEQYTYHVQLGPILVGQINLQELPNQPRHRYRKLHPITKIV